MDRTAEVARSDPECKLFPTQMEINRGAVLCPQSYFIPFKYNAFAPSTSSSTCSTRNPTGSTRDTSSPGVMLFRPPRGGKPHVLRYLKPNFIFLPKPRRYPVKSTTINDTRFRRIRWLSRTHWRGLSISCRIRLPTTYSPSLS
jgi:hypothetical protein